VRDAAAPDNSNLPDIHPFFRAIAELIAFQVMPGFASRAQNPVRLVNKFVFQL
jgi:hypothetical protein